MRMRTKIILGAILLNAITFTLVRIWWGLHGDLAATLETHIGDPEDKTMVYLIGGNLNQADTAFDFMRSEFGANYTFVQFSTKGWSPKATAKLIAQDIREHGYQARIFTISLGDHVARYLEKDLGSAVKVCAINPCPNKEALQSPLGAVLQYASPVAEVLCHTLGWISFLPIVPSWGGQYSPILLIDQYWSLCYDSPPMVTSSTDFLVCSDDDTLLRNDVLEKDYPDANVTYIDCGHSDIVNSAEKYYNAICSLEKD